MLTTNLIQHILATIPNRTIGLLGDLFLDRYLDIDPQLDEPSVETEKIAYQVHRVRAYPGALGTVMNNLVALGVGRLYPITMIGDDGEGYELRQCLAKMPGVETGGIITTPDRRTPTYTKPMYGSEELNRLDIKNRNQTTRDQERMILDLLDEAFPQFDALLVLDQVSEENCGVVTTTVREALREFAARDPEKFILADSRERIGLFRDVCIKPNWAELEQLRPITGSIGVNGKTLDIIGEPIDVGRTIFCTRGHLGIQLYEASQQQEYLPAFVVNGPTDICGAGDSCSAGIACAKVSGATNAEAASFGNLIASITVQQIGTTGTATPDQVRERWRDVTRLAPR